MNTKNILLFNFLVLLVSFSYICASISIPEVSSFDHSILGHHQSLVSNHTAPYDLETHYYNQTMDHFNFKPESYTTFLQKYYVTSKYWGGAKSNAPIFVHLGEESPMEKNQAHLGFIDQNAPIFKALVVGIEHRFYGESNPLGSMRKTINNRELRGYFNSAQALADYAQIILHIKKIYSAQHSPVIVIGGSYGGMLAAWFRLKYPHVALGALASSAPILDFDQLASPDGYYSVVTNNYKNVSQNCYETIRKSWSEIVRVASEPNGLSTLSMKFKTCSPLQSAYELTGFLQAMYTRAAQYAGPTNSRVTKICQGIDGAPDRADIIDKIFAGFRSRHPQTQCLNPSLLSPSPSDDSSPGWDWGWQFQVCTEMVTPMGVSNEDSMFPKRPFSLSDFVAGCKMQFNITPRPHWATTYYGGQDIKLVLKKFASNIIFSNGLRDPYSSSGVLEDISDSILAVYTEKGSHCLDIMTPKEDDPKWLADQRKREINIIRGWITKYNQDLRDSKI